MPAPSVQPHHAHGDPIDGYFDEDTRNALLAFQGAHAGGADGIVGPNTWKKLRG
ncbi:peptidoglycan-binding domain-containing protein [Streptomyces sp. 796.1]|uniref:peptidoglycan-binding domain-containing protein n=1 Tax=Streptomyces sp. 796.1 TaxID=3163029 RepID=UPI0039C9A7FB